jgi:hypothetical protein
MLATVEDVADRIAASGEGLLGVAEESAVASLLRVFASFL